MLLTVSGNASPLASPRTQGEFELSTVVDRIVFEGMIATLQPAQGAPDILSTYARGTFLLSSVDLGYIDGARWSAARLQFVDLKMRVDDQSKPEMVKEARAGTDGFLFVKYTPNGRIDELRFSPEWSSLRINLAQHILSGLQYSQPEWASMDWAAVESANGGDWRVLYTAEPRRFIRGRPIAVLPGFSRVMADVYRRIGLREADVVRKTWRQHLDPGRWDSGEALVSENRKRTGQMTIRLHQGRPKSFEGRVTSIHENEVRELTKTSLTFRATQKQNTAGIDSEMDRLPSDRHEAMAAAKRALSQWPPQQIGSTYESHAERMQSARDVLGPETLTSITASLERCERDKDHLNKVLHSLPDKIASLVALEPSSADNFARRVGEQSEATPLTYILAQGLAASGVPEGQSALVTVLQTGLADKEAAYIVMDRLAQAKSPSTTTADFLQRVIDTSQSADIREAAQLSFGTLVGRLKRQEPAWAMKVGRWMSNALLQSSTKAERIRVMRMVGNSGLEVTWPALEPHFTSSDIELAASALDAVRAFPVVAADELFVAALTAEDWSIRLAAASGLSGRRVRPQSLVAELASLKREPETNIRRVLVGSLWRSRKTEPRVIDAVATIARADPSPELRARAESLLLDFAKEQMQAVNKSRLPDPKVH